MKPLRPASLAASERADNSGSSGRGNGIRSMTTSDNAGPGTSTPCHRVKVPNRHEFSEAANFSTRLPMASSPWHITSKGRRLRISSAAASAPRREENRPNVRPPAALISSAISSMTFGSVPSRPGLGRCRAT